MYLRHCDIIELGDGTAVVRGYCRHSDRMYETPPLPVDALDEYGQGNVTAQAAFPDLDPPVREFLISGTSPEGWKRGILGITEE